MLLKIFLILLMLLKNFLIILMLLNIFVILLTLGTDHLTCWGGGGYVFFSDNTRVRIIFFFVGKAQFFFQNATLCYMTKTLIQFIFSFLHQNQNIFFSNIGNQNIVLEKKTYPPPPPPFKLNGRSFVDDICYIIDVIEDFC